MNLQMNRMKFVKFHILLSDVKNSYNLMRNKSCFLFSAKESEKYEGISH